MALVCVNGAKECCGCFQCREEDSGEAVSFCSLCGKRIDDGEEYTELFYSTLCLECLKALHKQ